MGRWLVNRNESHTAVDSLDELRGLARAGGLSSGDMVQRPGSTEWQYAMEIRELADVLSAGVDEDDLRPRRSNLGSALTVLVMLAVIAGGGWAAYTYSQQLPDPTKRLTDQVGFSQMVVTGKDVSLLAEPEAGAQVAGPAPDGQVMELLAKRGDFYRARSAAGVEGWLPIDQVLPMYLIGGGDVMKEYDPLYNPDRYLVVQNASWMQLPEQREDRTTVFQFMLRNMSDYPMTDIVMVARIKDEKGHELEQFEFRLEGVVEARTSSMVGMLNDPETDTKRLIIQSTFDELATERPELRLEYSDGVEVQMKTEDFTDASIDIVELRAVPKTEG